MHYTNDTYPRRNHMKTVYLSGPMTGYPEYNYPAFNKLEQDIKQLDPTITVINPTQTGVQPNWEWNDYLRHDLLLLLNGKPDVIVTLDNWEGSRGAKLEVHVAQQLGIRVVNHKWFIGELRGNRFAQPAMLVRETDFGVFTVGELQSVLSTLDFHKYEHEQQTPDLTFPLRCVTLPIQINLDYLNDTRTVRLLAEHAISKDTSTHAVYTNPANFVEGTQWFLKEKPYLENPTVVYTGDYELIYMGEYEDAKYIYNNALNTENFKDIFITELEVSQHIITLYNSNKFKEYMENVLDSISIPQFDRQYKNPAVIYTDEYEFLALLESEEAHVKLKEYKERHPVVYMTELPSNINLRPLKERHTLAFYLGHYAPQRTVDFRDGENTFLENVVRPSFAYDADLFTRLYYGEYDDVVQRVEEHKLRLEQSGVSPEMLRVEIFEVEPNQEFVDQLFQSTLYFTKYAKELSKSVIPKKG